MHCGSCPDTIAWSTINASEALPGVVSPLGWALFGDGVEKSMKGAFCDLGAMSASEVLASSDPAVRLWDVFYGRAAGNLNTFRMLADRMPGTNGDAVEDQIFGQVRPGVENEPTYRRYPVIALKLPYGAARVRSRLEREAADIEPWWRRTVFGEPPSGAAARELAAEGRRRFERVMRPHTFAAMICQALYEQVRVLAERAGKPGLEISLVTGYGEMAETDVVADLWDVSRDRLTLDEFVERHGYHGPSEGELSSFPWRMRREPLDRLTAAYRDMDESRAPRQVEIERRAERLEAEREVLAALPAARRPLGRMVLRIAERMIPLRGTGKASFLQCSDVVRFATRAVGADLAEAGELEDPEDAFMLTFDELLGTKQLQNIGEVAAERRAREAEYLTTGVPDLWTGMPERIPVPEDGADRETGEGPVTGTPVSPGVVTARARLVLDPAADDTLEPGEVLVCRTTDPSWASVMMLASALVIDIGGPISHGAIVARELGIPCVIGTRNGTAAIRTGDLIEVDGEKGEVVVLEPGSKESERVRAS